MVGPFPPPVFGSTVVTAAMRDALIARGYRVREINSAAPHLDQEGLFARVYRRMRVSLALVLELARNGQRTSVYISLAGQSGQFGDLSNAILTRLFGRPLIFHHHSFAYIHAPRFLARLLFGVAGKRARHIFLCHAMRKQATRRYPSIRRGYILSNAAFVEMPGTRGAHGPLRNIGFFANITLVKGIDRFLEIAKLMREQGISIGFKAAGPYRDSISRQLTETAIKDGLISYYGPLAENAKQRFFDAIDVLVLPSRYLHEAEPIVVLEALAMGIPIIATNRGCVGELIGNGSGFLLDRDGDELDAAVQQIKHWISDPDHFANARGYAIARGSQLHDSGCNALKIVLSHMTWRP